MNSEQPKEDIWFVYDGECPLCQMGARYYQLRAAVGKLITVDARTEHAHPVMQEIKQAGWDMNDGMVIKYQQKLYQGSDALVLMARLGAEDDIFNRINHRLFASESISKMAYPWMKAMRSVLITLKGVGKIGG